MKQGYGTYWEGDKAESVRVLAPACSLLLDWVTTICGHSWAWRQARAETSKRTAASRDLVLQLFMPSEELFHSHLLYCLLAPKEDFSTLAAKKLQNFPLGPSHVVAISQAADRPCLSCSVWKARQGRSREEPQPALKHCPTNSCYAGLRAMLC